MQLNLRAIASRPIKPYAYRRSSNSTVLTGAYCTIAFGVEQLISTAGPSSDDLIYWAQSFLHWFDATK